MSNYPITGRVKRAPAKQVKDATVGGDGETITTKTDADKGKDGSGTGKGGRCSQPNPPPWCKKKFKNPKVPGQTYAEFKAAPCGSPGKPFGTANAQIKGQIPKKAKTPVQTDPLQMQMVNAPKLKQQKDGMVI